MSLSTIAAAASVATAIFGGHTTTQSAPFALRVDDGALTGMLIQADFECDAGYGASWSGKATFGTAEPQIGDNVFAPTTIAADGSFATTGKAVGRYGKDHVGTITEQLQGSVRDAAAHGTYSATLVVSDPATGATVTTCQSGTIRWKARSAPKRVYAGQTAAGEPLVIERTRDGRKIKWLWVSWVAPCPSGGAFEVGHGLSNFSIGRNGRFGDRWDDGPERYTFRGRIRGSRASGSFGAQVLKIDADSVELCKSPVTRWTARSTP